MQLTKSLCGCSACLEQSCLLCALVHPKFTCFVSTKIQIMTLTRLPGPWLELLMRILIMDYINILLTPNAFPTTYNLKVC